MNSTSNKSPSRRPRSRLCLTPKTSPSQSLLCSDVFRLLSATSILRAPHSDAMMTALLTQLRGLTKQDVLKVDDLAWSQLRPRRSIPQCVADSIPPDDMRSFLCLLAKDPVPSLTESIAMRDRLRGVRVWRVEAANPSIVRSRFVPPHRAAKRPRGGPTATDTPSCDESRETDLEFEDQPRRKQRRSGRPSLGGDGAPSGFETSEESSTPVQIGDEYQASVPAEPLPGTHWISNPPTVCSKLVFSESICDGAKNIDDFLRTLNDKLRRRDGFELSPFALEVALMQFAECRGSKLEALKRTMKSIPTGPFLPGIKSACNYDEQCMFVRTIAERGKNFWHISRNVLPNRRTSELVWMYYTQHKQLWLQNGGMKNGQVLDNGGEGLKHVFLTTNRTISALRSLAITAGDGFPIDSRAQQVINACRRARVADIMTDVLRDAGSPLGTNEMTSSDAKGIAKIVVLIGEGSTDDSVSLCEKLLPSSSPSFTTEFLKHVPFRFVFGNGADVPIRMDHFTAVLDTTYPKPYTGLMEDVKSFVQYFEVDERARVTANIADRALLLTLRLSS